MFYLNKNVSSVFRITSDSPTIRWWLSSVNVRKHPSIWFDKMKQLLNTKKESKEDRGGGTAAIAVPVGWSETQLVTEKAADELHFRIWTNHLYTRSNRKYLPSPEGTLTEENPIYVSDYQRFTLSNDLPQF